MGVLVKNLDWDKPCLGGVAEYLAGLGGASVEGPLDLSGVKVVVQTREGRRRILLALARRAREQGRVLFPPRVLMPEVLLDEQAPPSAGRAELMLAWLTVLGQLKPDGVPALFRTGGSLETLEQRLAWARLLSETQRLLGENLLTCADVVAGGGLPPLEWERWQSLQELEAQCDAILARWGLLNPTAARRKAMEDPGPSNGAAHLVLVLLTDPLPALKPFLEKLAAHPHAPQIHTVTWGPADGSAFDGWGLPDATYWLETHAPRPELEGHLHPSRNSREEALQIAELAAPNLEAPGAVAIGVQTGEVLPDLQHLLDVFDPAGSSFSTTSLYALLGALRRWLATDSFGALVQVLRHPLIHQNLRAEFPEAGLQSLLAACDRIDERHLPDTLADALRLAAKPGDLAVIQPALARWRRQLERAPYGESLLGWLDALGENYRPGAALREEWESWIEVLPGACAAVTRIEPESADSFLGTVLALLEQEMLYPAPDSPGIRADGWLELALEEAPHLILAECADEYLPGTARAHPFLPDSLRRRLGLRHQEARLAHDAWLLSCLERSRREAGRIDYTVARSNRRGEPLKPTRLFFLGSSRGLPERVITAFRPPAVREADPPWTLAWKLRPPAPQTRQPTWESLPVTAFRQYLACPFRFYLRYGLKMESLERSKLEWDARDFGMIAHHALQKLAEDDPLRDSTDEARIAEALQAFADEAIQRHFGTSLPLPLEIQRESLRQRLRAWSAHEAASRRAGWCILPGGVEWSPDKEDDRFRLGGLRITGKIDRIEQHRETGALRVIDFKTSDRAETPDRAHRRQLRKDADDDLPPWAEFEHDGKRWFWCDLQLPLYVWMISLQFPDQPCEACYANLPKTASDTGIASWPELPDSALMEAARACAERCAEAIREGRFWPPRDPGPYDDFASLFPESPEECFDPEYLLAEMEDPT